MAIDIDDIEGSNLSAAVDSELRSAKRYADTELSDKRAKAMEYMRGEMNDVPPRPNGSQMVSRDLSDAVGWILPGVIRVFTASDHMAMFEAENPGDEEGARQATDYINYIFFKDNKGYRTLYNTTHDSLVNGDGVVRHYWDPTPITTTSMHSGISEEQIAMLMEEEGVNILAQRKNEYLDTTIMTDPATGQEVAVPIETYDIKIERIKRKGKLCVESGKPENLFLDPEATEIEDARFVAYLHDDRTRSDLIEMGFDREVVEGLPADSMMMSSEEELARNDEFRVRTDNLKSQQLIDLYECYMKADVDGDGVAELLQVWYAGASGAGEVLSAEVWDDEIPYSLIPCYPVPHRQEADGLSDRTMDIQRVKTVLLRQGIDNLYASNLPMREVEAGSVENPDILVNPKFGGTIWKKKGAAPIVSHAVPFVADKAFTALEYMDEVTAKRTGVSRTTMALDPETLQNQTATANQNQKDAGYSQIELIARNMAELGWTRVFRQMLKIVVKNQDRARVIRLRDKFVEIDPRVWNADMDVTVNVGLGTGSRDRDMAMLQGVLQSQLMLADRFQASGAMEDAIDMLPKILNTMVKIAESAGLKNPEAYYPEYAEEKVAELKRMAAEAAQKPDPETERKMAEAQADAQIKQQEMVFDQQQAEREFQYKYAQLEAEMQLKREQLSAELALKREVAMAELALKRELGQMSAAASDSGGTSSVRMGGEPG
ncbi:hypothetical protein OF122_13000 [Pelagibacterium flavum]|uniref:Portal protein n=1 Tax=Pelagibacterium flavum TaxID=2984530 RepID=A0ABY6IKE8_9HYPH|nr:hypothetical protein [Pelagibacterium sp. YIM 151497]UYQ70976.1 hypothetical protein OF122_13000 [Pelagibacterium sp. YIM 151497]